MIRLTITAFAFILKIERNSMKILKISLGILIVLSAVELIYYFTLVNPIKSLISRDKSEVKKSISSVGDEVLIGDIVDYFRSKTIKPGISYVLNEEIDGYLTKAEINEEKGRKFVSVGISTSLENGENLNNFFRSLENADSLFFRINANGEKQIIDPADVKPGVRVKQYIRKTLHESDILKESNEIQILE